MRRLDFTVNDATGNFEAVGAKGIYTVVARDGLHVLTAVGHDRMSMLTLPTRGMEFNSFSGAAAYAQRIDRVPGAEPQMSGS